MAKVYPQIGSGGCSNSVYFWGMRMAQKKNPQVSGLKPSASSEAPGLSSARKMVNRFCDSEPDSRWVLAISPMKIHLPTPQNVSPPALPWVPPPPDGIRLRANKTGRWEDRGNMREGISKINLRSSRRSTSRNKAKNRQCRFPDL